MRYLTISGEATATVREKMSRFIAFAVPVGTAGEARAVVARIANEYHDARHVCWAYMVGAERNQYLSTDNGEPSGTAGKPILGQINSFNLTNIVVVVVRYFGGIKLGTPGLIAAYREAARAAISEAMIVERQEVAQVRLVYPYLAMNDVMRVVKAMGLEVKSQDFDNLCTIVVSLPLDDVPELKTRINGIAELEECAS